MADHASKFDSDKHYTRREIHDLVGGGSLQLFLPTLDGKVLCGCFTVEDGPDVPETVLVSDGPHIYGSTLIFCEQKHFIPVFIFDNGKRNYRGEYRVKDWSESSQEIARQSKRSGRTNIKRVLRLEKQE